MKQVCTGIQLKLKRGNAVGKYRRPVLICLVALGAASLAALLLWPAARNGMAALCNLLFEASERQNAYAYDRLAVSSPENPVAAAMLLGLILAALCAVALLLKCRAAAVFFMLGLAGAEIYFGITLALLPNLLLFALPGLMLLRNASWRTGIVYFAVIVAVLLFFSVSLSGVDARLEAASELTRDRLDRVEQIIRGVNKVQEPDETQKTHQENRLDEQDASLTQDESQSYHDYQLEQEPEQEISKPQKINYRKIVLIAFLILALLLAPFLPFVLLDSRRRKALERRAAFQSEDCAEAIRGMFVHLNAYLESETPAFKNRQFSDCSDDIAKRWSAEYAGRYSAAVELWQEAAYSGHTMTQPQRSAMREMLDETENMVYDKADRKTRFKLKYIECLHV